MILQALLTVFAQNPDRESFDYLLGKILGSFVGFGLGALAAFLVLRMFLRPKQPTAGAPCPHCGNRLSMPVSFTWWGGYLGPKLVHLVECTQCKTNFNGKTGTMATRWIIFYLTLGIILALLLVWLLLSQTVFAQPGVHTDPVASLDHFRTHAWTEGSCDSLFSGGNNPCMTLGSPPIYSLLPPA